VSSPAAPFLPFSSSKLVMQIVITAVGPDNVGLADPIIHYVTGEGGNITEIQMYDHDEEAVFAMMLRLEIESARGPALRQAMDQIGQHKGLSIRTWSPPEPGRFPRLAICTTYRPEPALALLRAIRDHEVRAVPAVMIGNRPHCRGLAEQFGVDWHMIGDDQGQPDEEQMLRVLDEYQVDYVILARYMRVLPPSSCWKYAGGRIVNLHHGLLPGFPGMRPYHDAYQSRMLTFGATSHFIVPELDAGNQIICQTTFSVRPGTPLNEILRRGQEDNEPRCLVEGVRRVVDREVQLHFHKVIATRS
jgi:formyltetrahydrofolate deformylase